LSLPEEEVSGFLSAYLYQLLNGEDMGFKAH